eukprot:scaffold24117_cov31-Tisochrysis_lutea.AAC.1
MAPTAPSLLRARPFSRSAETFLRAPAANNPDSNADAVSIVRSGALRTELEPIAASSVGGIACAMTSRSIGIRSSFRKSESFLSSLESLKMRRTAEPCALGSGSHARTRRASRSKSRGSDESMSGASASTTHRDRHLPMRPSQRAEQVEESVERKRNQS